MATSPERSGAWSPDTAWVTGIFLAALVVRLVAMVALGAHEIGSDWEFGYETGQIARSLAEGEGFSSPFTEPTGPTAWLAPGFPWLLSLVFWLFGTFSGTSAIAILTLNSVFSAASCVAAYYLGREVFGERTGRWVSVLLVLYPPSIWHAINTIWDTSLFALLILLALLAIYPTLETVEPRKVFAWALLVGVSGLVNPAILLVIGILWFDLFFSRVTSRSRRLKRAGWATLVALAVISPWMLRNSVVLGQPVLRSNFGFEVHLGNNQEIWQNLQRGRDVAPWYLGHPSVLKRELEEYRRVGEMAYVRAAQRQAFDFIKEHPSKFLWLTRRRVEIFWLSDLRNRNDWTGNLDLTAPVSWVKTACHIVPLPFAILGLVVALRKRLQVAPLVYFLVLFPMLYYVTHVSERYRYPIEPVLLLFAVFGLVYLVRMTRGVQGVEAPSARYRSQGIPGK